MRYLQYSLIFDGYRPVSSLHLCVFWMWNYIESLRSISLHLQDKQISQNCIRLWSNLLYSNIYLLFYEPYTCARRWSAWKKCGKIEGVKRARLNFFPFCSMHMESFIVPLLSLIKNKKKNSEIIDGFSFSSALRPILAVSNISLRARSSNVFAKFEITK